MGGANEEKRRRVLDCADDLLAPLGGPVETAVIHPDVVTVSLKRLDQRQNDRPVRARVAHKHVDGTVFVVLDPSLGEVARFIETAGELAPAIDAMNEIITAAVAGEAPEEARASVRGKRTAYRVAHAKEWGEVILRAFGRAVAEGLALPAKSRPAVGGTKWPPEG